MSLHPGARHSRVVLALLAVLGMVVALAMTQATASAGPLPKPTSMTITAATDPSIAGALSGAPSQALPDVLAGPGTPFTLTVSLWAGTAPAAFPNDQVVAFSATGLGFLSQQQGTITAGASTTTFTSSYSQGAISVVVTAAVGKGKTALTASTQSFRVEDVLTLLAGDTPSLKNGTAGADGAGCSVVDPAHPMCGVISLPRGATGTVGLSLGQCPAGQACPKGALVTQLIANLTNANGAIYSRSAPAVMTIICDKSVCGKKGVTDVTALWSQSATGDLLPAPACPAKRTIGANQAYCTDYVSSTKDNAGDVHLVVLFLNDVRGATK